MSQTQGKTILHLVFLLGDTRSGPWLQKKDPNKCPNLLPLRRGLALIPRPYREGPPCSLLHRRGPAPPLPRREGGAHRSRRVVCPRSFPAALPCGVRQRRGGARLKEAAGGNPGSTRTVPDSVPAANLIYAHSRSSGCRCEQVSASGSISSQKLEQVKEVVCLLPPQICGSRGW